MKTYSYFDLATGLFTGGASHCPESVSPDRREGCGVIEGLFDYLSQRVDLSTGEVVDYRPPQPSHDHGWDAHTKRWVLTPVALERIQSDTSARRTIEAQEAGSLRAIRELLLNPENAKARQKLEQVEAQIRDARQNLRR